LKKFLIGGLFALALFVWLGNYFFKPLSSNDLQQPSCPTVKVKRGNVISKLSGRGVIRARRIIDVRPESTGRIEEILVKEGQKIISGTPLIKIKSGSDYQIRLHAISKELNDSNAILTVANKNLNQQKKLFAAGLVAKMKIEEAEKAVAEAMRRLNSAKAKAHIFEKETGLKVDAHLSFGDDLYSYVIAPITGTVVEINACGKHFPGIHPL
jgi:multidrug efflux pump subunit AcrA (membrane-fusion protein)